MKVLHLFSNSKWTGPAEPALNLCLSLRELGVACDFACSPGNPDVPNKIVETARDRGLEPILRFHLPKHRHPLKMLSDRLRLGSLLRSGQYDLVHCHLDNDHRIAAGPATKREVPLIRSNYDGEGLRQKDAAKLLRRTDHLIEPSQLAADTDTVLCEFPREKMTVVQGAVDTERFDPAREVPDGRKRLQIPPDAFVVGIVARMQLHRHFEDLWDAAARWIKENPRIHVLVVGRGTNEDVVGREPVRRLGIEDNVHFSGYVAGDDYVGMLKAFDLKVFLVPGTDGTCRAVREAMAMAKPVIAANRGMLAEIVENGKNGVVFDGMPDALHAIVSELASKPDKVRAMGQAAREKALTDYSLPAQARSVYEIYQSLLGEAGHGNNR